MPRISTKEHMPRILTRFPCPQLVLFPLQLRKLPRLLPHLAMGHPRKHGIRDVVKIALAQRFTLFVHLKI